jgi:hypothetical protein
MSPLRNLTLDDPPTRHGIWKMLAEAFGYFTGSIKLTDIANPTAFQETQVKFLPVLGHSHNGTAGSSLATSAIHEKVLDLNDCQVALGRYFGTGVVGSNIYAFLGGSASCLLGTCVTISQASTSPAANARALVWGSVSFDYNPNATWAGGNSLHIRALSTGYDSASFASNWTLIHVFPTMGSTGANPLGQFVYHHHWCFWTGVPYLYIAAATSGTSSTISASALTGTVYFDYAVAIKQL